VIRLKRIILSRTGTISLLLVGTIWDVGSTYAMVGKRLWLDGNPFIRTLNWQQVAVLQVIFGTAAIAAFLFAYGRQKAIWPKREGLAFLQFVKYRIRRGFSLNFTAKHFKTEDVYAGMLLIWVLIFAHGLAGLINTVPILGGPSFLEIFQMEQINDVRIIQNIGTALLLLCSILFAHYPIYASYRLSLEDA
jgi:hypothetical protein